MSAPFQLAAQAVSQKDSILKSRIPTLGEKVKTATLGEIVLEKSISSGGEGTIYEVKNNKDFVCKIYHQDKLTLLRKQKIELMLSKQITFNGICWPVDTVSNSSGDFVGYIMPRAHGKPMQTCMFIKPILLKNFPNWKRSNLTKIALAFLEKMSFLHSMNIIVGDINPLNILVDESGEIWFVDTDSYQIENFPCPVGTVNFTAPEIQGKDYATFMRTKEHELFAVATMLFMILLPGKPPYSQQGGESQSDNIKKMNFSYWCNEKSETAPEGPWVLIWANFINKLQEAFCLTFKQNKRRSIPEWQNIINTYKWAIEKGHSNNELFPTSMRIMDPIETVCGNCLKISVASEKWVEKMRSQGKGFLCGECLKRIKLEKLAKTSFKNKIATRTASNNVKMNQSAANNLNPGGMYYKGNKNSNKTTKQKNYRKYSNYTYQSNTNSSSDFSIVRTMGNLIKYGIILYIGYNVLRGILK